MSETTRSETNGEKEARPEIYASHRAVVFDVDERFRDLEERMTALEQGQRRSSGWMPGAEPEPTSKADVYVFVWKDTETAGAGHFWDGGSIYLHREDGTWWCAGQRVHEGVLPLRVFGPLPADGGAEVQPPKELPGGQPDPDGTRFATRRWSSRSA